MGSKGWGQRWWAAPMAAALAALPVLAADDGGPAPVDQPLGRPEPWMLWHQAPATPVMERLDEFHQLLLVIMVAICLFVVALLAYVVLRFHHTRNPTPSRTTHNTWLEVAWTGIPVLILLVIAVPSFRALYYLDTPPANPDMMLKIIGRQWYWDYEYPDQGGLAFSSYMVPDDQLPPGGLRLLEVDNRAVVPVGAVILLHITGGDVIHSMAMPSLGIKRDAIPGRLNESWMRIDRPGVYYGQCSEICGTNHAYMPMVIEAVPPEQFKAWVEQKRAELGQAPTRLADAGTPAPTKTAAAEAAP